MNDRFDKLILEAKPHAPPHTGVLAAVSARGIAVDEVGAAAWILRAAAIVALAAGVGALTALLSSNGVGSPAAGDATVLAGLNEQIQQDVSPRVAALEYAAMRDDLSALTSSIDALESARIEQCVADVLEQRRLAERKRWQERHISYVSRRYERKMKERLIELEEQGLNQGQLAQAREVLAAHGQEAVALVRRNYADGERVSRDDFALLARETEDRLLRVTGGNGWHDLLGADPEQWGPTENFRDWDDYDSLVDWTRRISRG
jgi:hypothetical protein